MIKISAKVQFISFIALLPMIISIGVVIAVQTRTKINNSVFTFEDVKTMKVHINYDVSFFNIDYDPTIPTRTAAGNFSTAKGNITMPDVYNRADLIVKAKATDDRSFAYESILTKVEVLEVYKGSLSLNEIYVYECAQVDLMMMLYPNYGCYNIMNTGDEYYLFLNCRIMPDGYKYTEKDRATVLLTNVHLGKYNVKVSKNINLFEEPENIISWEDFVAASPSYQQVADWDILPVELEQIDFYMNNRKEALIILKIDEK
jgi:hypothetical protein